jgi:hypothetical protein
MVEMSNFSAGPRALALSEFWLSAITTRRHSDWSLLHRLPWAADADTSLYLRQ